jgi:4-hydroxy-3-methylbut-2-enyl diphosphate reductase
METLMIQEQSYPLYSASQVPTRNGLRVMMAESYGMCFGVRDAVSLALGAAREGELTVLGELAHNPAVLARLSAAGVERAPSLEPPSGTRRVMITAHGTSNVVRERLRNNGLEVLDATCPLVNHAHRMLLRLVGSGYFPVVIGRAEHVEVRGLVGDLAEHAVVENDADVEALPERLGVMRLGVVSQTTQPLERVLALVDRLRARFPQAEVKFVDTVCAPTKERQTAARRLGASCPVVIVVGGRGSNNTRQLVRTCEAEGARAYQVESAEDLRPEWVAGVEQVGLTAGTSTPDEVVEAVRGALVRLAEQPLPLAA